MNSEDRMASILLNLEKTTGNLANVTKGLSEGKGSLGGMLHGGPNDDLGPALKSLRKVLDKVEKGQGTLGALVNDSSLHEDLRLLLGGAKRSQVVRFLIRQAIQSQDEAKEAEASNQKKK
jgi:phospholipid/cholesterol/gamma-HCH transport system substrate-binding protein